MSILISRSSNTYDAKNHCSAFFSLDKIKVCVVAASNGSLRSQTKCSLAHLSIYAKMSNNNRSIGNRWLRTTKSCEKAVFILLLPNLSRKTGTSYKSMAHIYGNVDIIYN
jgi:hypothetical protein